MSAVCHACPCVRPQPDPTLYLCTPKSFLEIVSASVHSACTLDPSEESLSCLSHIPSMNTRTAPPAPMQLMSRQRPRAGRDHRWTSLDSALSASTQSPQSPIQGALHTIPGMWPALPLLSPAGQWAPGLAGWRLLSGAGSLGSLHRGVLCFSSRISGPFLPFPKCPATCSSHTRSRSASQEILRPSPAVRPHAHTCSSLVPRERHSRAHTLPSGS